MSAIGDRQGKVTVYRALLPRILPYQFERPQQCRLASRPWIDAEGCDLAIRQLSLFESGQRAETAFPGSEGHHLHMGIRIGQGGLDDKTLDPRNAGEDCVGP